MLDKQIKGKKEVKFICSAEDYAFLKKACFYFGTTIPALMRTFISQLRSADWAQLLDDHEV